ncbi:MAG: sigma 54-interacting transcriptional regulator [Desulfobacteraceae bacterium]|jgi:transcriptional regulator with PAS, ATPase and Fis domain
MRRDAHRVAESETRKPGQIKKRPRRANRIQEELEIYKLTFDSIYNGALVTDADGYVTHFNKPYGEFLGVDPEAQIGKHCTEVVENTRMHIVAQTGKPEINQTHLIKGQRMVVQRIPIKKNGQVIAVFGQVMFKDVRDVTKLAKKLSLLESKVELYEQELMSLRSTRHTLDSIVGESAAIKSLIKEALTAAATLFPVLISGESGTGKELFAQGIHHASPRKLHPFIRINCAAIPKDLLESELFGYEKGAFTGARSAGKPGKFELAKQGTVFLDEIGDLPLQMQPKLLRVLEDKEFERVGGTTVLRSDFRLIAATNQNLEEMLAERRFRKDLFYRLNVIPLHIPPLRERRDDIMPLTTHLLQQLAEEASLPEINIDSEAEEALYHYHWPGNIRELSNVLERVLSSLEGDTIHLSDLPFYLYRSRKGFPKSSGSSMRALQARAEKEAILDALKRANNNKARAARMLGIHRTHLYKKMKKYGFANSMAYRV